MPESLQTKKINTERIQYCPLCNMPQEGFVHGMETIRPDDEAQYMRKVEGKWYSFCNCKNIFFTDWSNMQQDVYDDKYQEKYAGVDELPQHSHREKDTLLRIYKPNKTFLEIGVAYDLILDIAKELGMKTIALDINKDIKTKHTKIIGNIEDEEVLERIPKVDVLWASHIVEHFKDPIKSCKNIYNLLNEDGLFCVFMPDPYFIEWEMPELFGHWHYKEHHIMWDMDSFIDEMLAIGFELVSAKRRPLKTDYEIILRKP